MTNVHAPARLPFVLQLSHDAANCLGEGFGRSVHVDRSMHGDHGMPDTEAPDLGEGGAHDVLVDPGQNWPGNGVNDHHLAV